MFSQINNSCILIAPLDWGLGHATRCIPIIENLLESENKIVLAGSGLSGELLKNEFPQLEYFEFPSYNISYKNRAGFSLEMALQVPKILSAIKQENRVMKELLISRKFDLIISDNRYGVRHKSIRSIFIGHQLTLHSPIFSGLLNYFHTKLIEKFDECWVPDFFEMEKSLAGNLSHTTGLKIPVKYLGPLSRFRKIKAATNSKKILVVLSGPEPERSNLEEIILAQLKTIKGFEFVLVRGTTSKISSINYQTNYIVVKDLASKKDLENLFSECNLIICRSGYSSLMDLFYLEKKAIIIPTPGQWEQEYLGNWNRKNTNFLVVEQGHLNLQEQINWFFNI